MSQNVPSSLVCLTTVAVKKFKAVLSEVNLCDIKKLSSYITQKPKRHYCNLNSPANSTPLLAFCLSIFDKSFAAV